MNAGLRILVVDDERLSRMTAVRQLTDAGYVAQSAPGGAEALAAFDGSDWDVVLCDLRMPGMDGIELLRRLRREQPDVDVLLMTAYATVETAVEAMQAGAADYLTKPFRFHELDHRLGRLAELRRYRREVASLRALLDAGDDEMGLVGTSPPMRAVRERIHAFAAHEAPVLVTGETGTGKEVISRALHRLGKRADGPFVPVACGAIPGSLAESELFGHERGAFTGATSRRLGAFERADGGTLLLDDIDDLPLDLQAALLRVLQEGTLLRVGGSREIRVDVRVVATTKVDLAAAAAVNRFRDDLYYRLRVLEVHLPPLRERGGDVLLLAQHFLDRLAQRGGAALSLSAAAAAALTAYPWPGNVRELSHAIEAITAICRSGQVRVEHLPGFLVRQSDGPPGAGIVRLDLRGVEVAPLIEILADVEARLFAWALQRADGKQTRAAELLAVPRTTFQSRLGKLPDAPR